MMSKKNIIIGVVLVLIIAVLGFLQYKTSQSNGYSVVYLTTGEVYVGKLSVFPDLTLKDGYILQVNKDATDPAKNTFQLNPTNQALWATQVLHLVKENVVFYGSLMSNSKIAETLATQKNK
jgi:hypothetical protein